MNVSSELLQQNSEAIMQNATAVEPAIIQFNYAINSLLRLGEAGALRLKDICQQCDIDYDEDTILKYFEQLGKRQRGKLQNCVSRAIKDAREHVSNHLHSRINATI